MRRMRAENEICAWAGRRSHLCWTSWSAAGDERRSGGVVAAAVDGWLRFYHWQPRHRLAGSSSEQFVVVEVAAGGEYDPRVQDRTHG